ncbi:CEI_1a_G0046000.mRNA.1.CDS.1 [Saccharomyces cerevisiae]|nr:CEI_1a_G0046000.mRNA.1.CDS.1 [Saccharomyces cerevisiae]CAI4743334.1 AMH_1a_G0046100.mRNA.1.CDS.1 [Saccharomyces cerevisiae]CAI6863063.1 AMH_1a_G0046100.mRNA.1.CDS.1 [Saccharomyces cerevisiae]CAI7446169.1 CEI_1a_G0046000.mRNA.1.CDS.1 [Saccharomyces cerevisiae]
MILALGDFLPKQEDKACERPWVQFPARPFTFFHHQGGIFLFSINQPNLSCFSKLKEVNSLYVPVATYICQKNESRFRTNRLKGEESNYMGGCSSRLLLGL